MQSKADMWGSTRPWGITSTVIWVLSYMAARAALDVVERGSALSIVIALAPILPFMVVLYVIIRGIRGVDELERRIQLEALAIAFPLSVLLVMLLGLLQLATDLNPADWSYRHIWPLMGMFWIAGAAIARKKYS